MPDIARYREFARKCAIVTRKRLFWNGPFFLSHLVTGACNLSCASCLWKSSAQGDLPPEEIVDFYRGLRENGFVANVIWGGEPLMRKDIAQIIRASSDNNFFTVLITNGYYLEEAAGELNGLVDVYIVSIDHHDPAVHDEIRGKEGLFQRAMAGIDKVRRLDPEAAITLNHLLLKKNQGCLPELLELARDRNISIYISPIEIGLMQSTGLKREKEDIVPSQEEETETIQYLIRKKRDGYPINNSLNFLKLFIGGKKHYTCRYPRIIFEVDHQGNVVDCMRLDQSPVNIREKGVKEVLAHPRLREMASDAEACHKCNNPDRIDMSYIWDIRPEPFLNISRQFIRQVF